MTPRRGDQSGQVVIIFAITLIGLLAVTALVVDGGLLFAARRNLQSLADGAARTGAMSLDENLLRSSSGSTIQLDPTSAEQAVRQYLSSSGYSDVAEVSADSSSVRVELTEQRQTLLMGIAGIRTITGTATSVASPEAGTE
jgi:uncharacterized membrane protein